jgi:hypothetical protein
MPVTHTYEGSVCNKRDFRFFARSGSAKFTYRCNKCRNPRCKAELLWEPPSTGARDAGEQSLGIVYYKNPQGQYWTPPGPGIPPPAGYTRHTTTTYHEAQLLEHSMQQAERRQSSVAREKIHQVVEFQEQLEKSERTNLTPSTIAALAHEERERRLAAEHDKHGRSSTYVPTIEDAEARARRAAEIAQKVIANNNRAKSDYTAIDTGLHIHALHNDARKR